MAETSTSITPPANGQASSTSASVPQQPAQQALQPGAQPSAAEQAAKPEQQQSTVNLFELPEFKAYQSQAARREQQLRQQFAATQQRLKEIETRGLDENELKDYKLRELEGQLLEQQRLAQDMQLQMQAEADMAEIAAHTGIPIKTLREKAQNLADAWRLGAEFMKTALEKQYKAAAAEHTAKVERNDVTVGVGASPVDADKFNQALTSRDPVAYLRAMRGNQ